MSFRKEPITKNCTVLDVMGRRIIQSSQRTVAEPDETTITHWQPFQIRGTKVTPCRVFYADPNFETPLYLPLINGVAMDEPDARLTGSGDVYLNVKFEFNNSSADNYLVISEDSPPNISTTQQACNLAYRFNFSTFTNTMTGTGWYSWNIGSIGDVRGNHLRYFAGSTAFDNLDLDSRSIYRKGDRYTDEWGAVGIFASSRQVSSVAPFPNPYEEPSEVFESQSVYTGSWSDPYSWKATAGVVNATALNNLVLFNAFAIQVNV